MYPYPKNRPLIDENRKKHLQIGENGSQNSKKDPLGSKLVGNQGVFSVLARIGTGNPSPTSKKRDDLSIVSLVGEAGLEG